MWGEAPVTSVSGELQMTSALCHCHGAIVLKHSMRKHCQWAGCLGFIGDERPLPSCKIIFKLGLCSQPPEKKTTTRSNFSQPGHRLNHDIKSPGMIFSQPGKTHSERNDLRLNRWRGRLDCQLYWSDWAWTLVKSHGLARPWWVVWMKNVLHL